MPAVIKIDLSAEVTKNQAEMRKRRDVADQIVAKVTSESRDFTPEEKAAVKEAQDAIVNLRSRNEIIESQIKASEGLDDPKDDRGIERDAERRSGDPDRRSERERRQDSHRHREERPELTDKERRHSEVYEKWMRKGMAGLKGDEQDIMHGNHIDLGSDSREARALSAVTGATGAFTVPVGFMNRVEVGLKDYSGVLRAGVEIMRTDSGIDLPWPTANDTNNEGEQIEENQTTTEGPDNIFGTTTLKAFMFSTRQMIIPRVLLQDTGIDIEGLLAQLASERLGRIINRRLTTGNGANQPQGIVNGSTLGRTAAASTAISYDELVDLQTSIDEAYEPDAGWMFNKSTFGILRKLKDSDGRPIWMPAMNSGMAGGAPGLLLDKPYYKNMHMATPASGVRSVLYGQFSKYKVRQVSSLALVRLDERYAEKFQVAFLGFARVDGRLLDAGTNPIKHLVHP